MDLKQFFDLVKGILVLLLILDAPLLGDLDLLLRAVFPGFVPAGLVVGLPAILLGVFLTELLGFRPTALVGNINTTLARLVPTRINWRLLAFLDRLPPAFLDILAFLVVRGVRRVRGGGRVLHSGHLGSLLCSDLLAESFSQESLAQKMLTEQVEVQQVDAALLPAGAVTQGGHASLGVALDLLGQLQQLRGGDVLQSLSQGLLVNVIVTVIISTMLMVLISRPLHLTGLDGGGGRLVVVTVRRSVRRSVRRTVR